MALNPELKKQRAAQRRAAHMRNKMLATLSDEMLEQLARVKQTLSAVGKRIRTAHIQDRLDDMAAEVQLSKHLGTGGHVGRRAPTLDELDNSLGNDLFTEHEET